MITKSNTAEDKFANGNVKQEVGNKATKKRSIELASFPNPKSTTNIRAQQNVNRFPTCANAGVDDVFDFSRLVRNPSRLRLPFGRRDSLGKSCLDLKSQGGHVGSSINLPRNDRQGSKVAANKSNRVRVLGGLTVESKPGTPSNVKVLSTRKCDEHSHSRVVNTGSCKQQVIINLGHRDKRHEINRQSKKSLRNKNPFGKDNVVDRPRCFSARVEGRQRLLARSKLWNRRPLSHSLLGSSEPTEDDSSEPRLAFASAHTKSRKLEEEGRESTAPRTSSQKASLT